MLACYKCHLIIPIRTISFSSQGELVSFGTLYNMVRCELLVVACVLHLLAVTALPVREKISINTDALAKVRESFNDTTRDKTARNINFAWRVSYTRTSTQPTVKTTPSIKDIEENQVEYQRIFSQLTVTLKDPTYRKMWTDLVEKGYPHFIDEIKKGGHKIFLKDNKDNVFEGPEGAQFWTKIVGFLETMGKKGFDLLLSSVDNTPLKTVAPGGEEQKADFTFPDLKGAPPGAEAVLKTITDAPKVEEKASEAPKAEDKPTEAAK